MEDERLYYIPNWEVYMRVRGKLAWYEERDSEGNLARKPSGLQPCNCSKERGHSAICCSASNLLSPWHIRVKIDEGEATLSPERVLMLVEHKETLHSMCKAAIAILNAHAIVTHGTAPVPIEELANVFDFLMLTDTQRRGVLPNLE